MPTPTILNVESGSQCNSELPGAVPVSPPIEDTGEPQDEEEMVSAVMSLARKTVGGEKASQESQNFAFFSFLTPLGLEPPRKQDWHLWIRTTRSKFICLLALALWSIMLGWVIFSVNSVLSGTNTPDRSSEIKAWITGPELLPVFFVKPYKPNYTVSARSCAIFNGNYSSYSIGKRAGKIIPGVGGCRALKLEKRSHLLDVPVKDGGCKQVENQNYADCWKLEPSKVVGQFGGPEFYFTKIKVLVPDPAWHLQQDVNSIESNASLEKRLHAVEKKLQIQELRQNTAMKVDLTWADHASVNIGDDHQLEEVWEAQKIDSTCDKMMNNGRYFQRKFLRQFDYIGWDLFMSGHRKAAGEDEGGRTSSWTQFYGEYTEWEPVAVEDGQLEVADFLLRATVLQEEVTERPRVTSMELPALCGGFFTGFLLLIAGLSARCAACCSFLYIRSLSTMRKGK